MAYEPFEWADGSDGGTPITAERLNSIERGVAASGLTATWGQVSNRPSTFAPAAHQHPASDITGTLAAAQIPTLAQSKVTGLASALDGKADASALAALVARVEALEAAEPGA